MGLFDFLGGGNSINPDLMAAAGEVSGSMSGGRNDFLRRIGDALLVANGRPSVLQEERRNQQAADAMAGMQTDPLAAIQNLARVDPELAQKAYQQYQANVLAQQKQAGEDLKDRLTIQEKAYGQAASMAVRGNPQTWAALRPRLAAFGEKYGLDTSRLPTTYDKQAIEDWAQGSVPLKDQNEMDYRTQRLGQLERGLNATVQEKKANVINRAANTQIAASRVGVSAANTGVAASRVGSTKGKAGIERPASATSPTKPFIVKDGKILRRQPDGSYK